MNRLFSYIITIMLFSLPVLSCGQDIKPPPLEKTEMEKMPDARLFVYQIEVSGRPPFYKGPLPLVFNDGKKILGGGGMGSVSWSFYHEFKGWRNEFIYSDSKFKYSGVADGARTKDASGKLLAEAKLFQLIKGEAIVIEEFHYSADRKVRFYCKSRISLTTGEKQSETDIKGKKEKEYYFIWPVHSF